MISAYKQDYAKKARDYLHDVTVSADLTQLMLARRAINRVKVLDELHRIGCPSLVLVGDQFGKVFVEINRRIADHLPRARFEVLADSMDPSCLVQPETFNRTVLGFLRQIE